MYISYKTSYIFVFFKVREKCFIQCLNDLISFSALWFHRTTRASVSRRKYIKRADLDGKYFSPSTNILGLPSCDSHTVDLSFHGNDEKFVMSGIVSAFLENVAFAGFLLRLPLASGICILPQPCECITQIKWRFADLKYLSRAHVWYMHRRCFHLYWSYKIYSEFHIQDKSIIAYIGIFIFLFFSIIIMTCVSYIFVLIIHWVSILYRILSVFISIIDISYTYILKLTKRFGNSRD